MQRFINDCYHEIRNDYAGLVRRIRLVDRSGGP